MRGRAHIDGIDQNLLFPSDDDERLSSLWRTSCSDLVVFGATLFGYSVFGTTAHVLMRKVKS